MKAARSSRGTVAIGSVLTLAGILISPLALVQFLRPGLVDHLDQLLLGAALFKSGLVVLGLVVIALGWLIPAWQPLRERQKSDIDPQRKSVLVILVVVLMVATALRLYKLDAGLWLDEILTNVLFARMPFGEIVITYESENQHFLYSLLAHASFQLFGESAWALRLPAVLFGVGSIGALYLLGREVANKSEALLSAALLTFSYQHVWFSQNARGYTGLLFWTILSSWLLLQALRQGLPRTWLFYAAATALGIYTHVTMLFVTAGQFLIYLWVLVARRRETWPGRWAGLFIGFGFAALLTFQLFALVMPQVLGGMGREASVVEAWKNPLWTLLEVARGLQISFAGSVMAVGALAVFGAGMVGYARTQPVVIHLLVIPSFICVALVVGLGHHLWPRFFFFAFGFAALVAVRGVTVLGEWAIRLLKVSSVKPAWTGIALGVGLAFFSAISIPAAYGPKQDYAGAIDFVETAKGPGDVIATTGLATFPYEKFYKVDWEDAEDLETLSALRSRAKQMWLVYTFPTVLRSVSPQVMASIERDFRIVKQFGGTVGDGTVFVAVAGHE